MENVGHTKHRRKLKWDGCVNYLRSRREPVRLVVDLRLGSPLRSHWRADGDSATKAAPTPAGPLSQHGGRGRKSAAR